jgi:hypothetical protein
MAIIIDKKNSKLNIYDWTSDKIPILELKRWVDTQIEMGMNNVSLDISWGYYNDIDGLDINASND